MLRAVACVLFCALATLPFASATAEDNAWTACRRAITAAEPGSGVPLGLLGAIALVESGRSDPRSGRFAPWPWTWNVEGEGHTAPSRAAAVSEVAALLARGQRSVDVGCMQVNLLHHPTAFPTLEEAFDPTANVRYAIAFLQELRARTGDWAQATANYHSGQVERGLAYHRRVLLARLGAAWASGGTVPLPLKANIGLCAPGLRPALSIRRSAARVVRASASWPRMVCQRTAQGS